jgi:hypothetical protein
MTLTGDGQVLLALDNGELSAWQVPTGTLLAQQAAAAVDSADDGGLLATVTGSSPATFQCPTCGEADLLLPDARRVLPSGLTSAQSALCLEGQPPEFRP